MTAAELFELTFKHRPSSYGAAPGRVNLIGEHLDYNGGSVLPFALHCGVEVAVELCTEPLVWLVSDRFRGVVEVPLAEGMKSGWARYAFFSVHLARDLGWIDGGARVAIVSNLRDGAGISSSAALCVSILKAIRAAAGIDIGDVEIAQLARRVENEYIGMPCGIMDQMAVALARPGSALYLDTSSLDFEMIALPPDVAFVTLHSGIHRELADGRYKERKEECDIAKQALGNADLCHVGISDIGAAGLPANVARRARHCVEEQHRVREAAGALKRADVSTLGMLMNESHVSMRDVFEVSAPGIDALVATAQREGALGARLTGGGFGGCIVACVGKAAAAAWTDRVLAQHPNASLVEG